VYTMIRNLNLATGPVAHIRFRGLSRNVPLENLGVRAVDRDADIFRALARYLEVAEGELSGHVLERHASGNVTLRPEAVFG